MSTPFPHEGVDPYDKPNDTESRFADPSGHNDGVSHYDLAYPVRVGGTVDWDYVHAHPDQFYTIMPTEWLNKAAARRIRTWTYPLIPGNDPIQVLRQNSSRRAATIMACCFGDANAAPLIVSELKSSLNNQYLKSLGVLAANAQLPSGNYMAIPVGPMSQAVNAQCELWAAAPWTTVGSYFLSVVEYFD